MKRAATIYLVIIFVILSSYIWNMQDATGLRQRFFLYNARHMAASMLIAEKEGQPWPQIQVNRDSVFDATIDIGVSVPTYLDLRRIYYDNNTWSGVDSEYDKNALSRAVASKNGEYSVFQKYEEEKLFRYYLIVKNKDKELIGAVLLKSSTNMGRGKYIAKLFRISGVHFFLLTLGLLCARYFNRSFERKESALQNSNSELNYANKTLVELMKATANENQKQSEFLKKQTQYVAMGEVVGAIAHQWRQPLNTVALYVQDLQDAYKYNEIDEKYLEEMVHKSMTELNKMSSIIDDFRQFFKPSRWMEAFGMLQSVEALKKLIKPTLDDKNISFLDTVMECYIEGYPNEFRQILLNIVYNSIYAIEKKGVGNFSEQHYIRIYNVINMDEVSLFIEDSGGGIDESILSQVFNPFFTTKGEGEGVGNGLYMAKLIIEKHMGGSLLAGNTSDGARIELRFHLSNSAIS